MSEKKKYIIKATTSLLVGEKLREAISGVQGCKSSGWSSGLYDGSSTYIEVNPENRESVSELVSKLLDFFESENCSHSNSCVQIGIEIPLSHKEEIKSFVQEYLDRGTETIELKKY